MKIIFQGKTWLIFLALLAVLVTLIWPRINIKEMSVSIPIRYTDVPDHLTLLHPPAKVIEVVVRGPKSKIKKMSQSADIFYPLDLSETRFGMNAFPVKTDHIPLPKGVFVLRSNLSLIVVKMDRQVQKQIPIRVVLSGKPGPGFVIADSTIEPPTAALCGPESLIAPIKEIKTKPIDIGGIKESFEKAVHPDLFEETALCPPDQVFLSKIFIEEKIIIKTLAQIPVTGKNTPYPYAVTPDAIELEIKGPQNIIDGISKGSGVTVFVDLADAKPGIYVRYATIELPVGVILIRVAPEIFTITVSKP